MALANQISAPPQRDAGPNLGVLAILYTVLFNAGLYPVTALAGKPYWPGPWESASVIVSYFQSHGAAVLTCLFLQSGATICLGLFAASVVGRLHFLGVRAAGLWIALLGGFLTVFNGIAASLMVWTMIRPEIIGQPSALLPLYYLSYAFGGPGFSIPMGLFMAGVCVPALIVKLLPRWMVIFGLVLAVAGELSWFHLISPGALFLIPLTRFPGFVWLIALGFVLPRTRMSSLRQSFSNGSSDVHAGPLQPARG
ncbi:hypothetical protein [Acidicapsa acidisoli]|uniref:hypothetical protein n=1 Tax=Acidicapsa acidisoli TaxID=1615681 RepID=UPI0021E0F5A5|nr:hypothetical protein [Acidicapsa acidisoli]